ncbi:uroporphyrinogen-III synthase [Cereibacter sphaeroides]|nr:uroporphyrinogen-III synthase [Cereibacter sphaeroides]
MLPILLITRPLKQGKRFAEEAEQACPPHRALIAPLSEVVPLPHDPAVFDGAKALILTSANAVPFLPPLAPLPAWCVGPATAQAAKAAGYVPIDGGGDAASLIARLAKARPEGPLIHAHGKDKARDIVAALPDLPLRGVAVYEARKRPLPPEILAVMGAADRIVAPLFSPRASRLLAAELAARAGVIPLDRVVPVAISPACAEALPPLLRARALIAGAPDGKAMMQRTGEALSQVWTAG